MKPDSRAESSVMSDFSIEAIEFHDDVPVFHGIAAAHLDLRPLPDADGAPDTSRGGIPLEDGW